MGWRVVRMTTASETLEVLEFAKKAAKCFQEKPDVVTFTEDGYLTEGAYLAVRWGLGNDCVVVLKIDESFAPVNFQGLVKQVDNGGKC